MASFRRLALGFLLSPGLSPSLALEQPAQSPLNHHPPRVKTPWEFLFSAVLSTHIVPGIRRQSRLGGEGRGIAWTPGSPALPLLPSRCQLRA